MEILMKILMKWLKIIASKVKITDKSQKRVHVTDRMSDGHVNTKVRKEIARGVRKFMEKNYELRYNIMKQTEEFRQKASYGNYSMSNSENNATFSDEKTGKWKPLTDRELRRIALEQMEQVGVAWSIDVEIHVRSALICDYGNSVVPMLIGAQGTEPL